MQNVASEHLSTQHNLNNVSAKRFGLRAFISQEFTRAFGGWFAIAVVITIVGLMLTDTGTIYSAFTLKSSSSSLPLESLEKSALFMISPVVVALPYSTSFITDHKSRYLRYLLPRCGWQRFTLWRFIANMVSSALCVFSVQLLLVLFSAIAYPYTDIPYRYVNAKNWFNQLEYTNVMGYILLTMIIQLPCHMARASTAISITPWIRNPFAALIAPLIFDNALSMLTSQGAFFFWLRERCILPTELVFWGDDMCNVIWYFTMAALRIVLCYIAFCIGVKRNAYK